MNDATNSQAQIDNILQELENFRLERVAILDKEKDKVNKARDLGGNKSMIVGLVLLVGIFVTVAVFFRVYILYIVGGSIHISIMFLILSFILRPKSYSPHPRHFQAYNRSVIKALLEKFYPNIDYVGDWYSFEKKVKNSLLFFFLNLDGENHLRGTTKNGYHFEIVEIESVQDGPTLFNGFFLRMESPIVFCEQIIIREGFVQYIPPYLNGSQIVSLNGAYPAFEKKYEIFSKNKSEAEKILSPDFLKPIYELAERHHAEIRWSFIGSNIYFAIEEKKKLFNPLSIYDTVLSDEVLKNFHTDIAFCMDIVEQISLQLEAIPEELKLEFKRAQNNEGNLGNAAYDHLIDNSEV